MNPLPSAKSAPICARKSSKAWHKRDAGLGSNQQRTQISPEATAATLLQKQNVSSEVSFIIDRLVGLLLLLYLRFRGGRNPRPNPGAENVANINMAFKTPNRLAYSHLEPKAQNLATLCPIIYSPCGPSSWLVNTGQVSVSNLGHLFRCLHGQDGRCEQWKFLFSMS